MLPRFLRRQLTSYLRRPVRILYRAEPGVVFLGAK